MPLQEPPAAVVEPVRGSSRDLLAPGSELAWRVASLSRSERGRVGACARALLQGEARRGAGRRGAARRAAAARGRSFCPGEAWLARRAVMTQHAEKSLVSHRGGSEPKQATCRMTGWTPASLFSANAVERMDEKWRDAAAKIGGRGEAEITNGLERNEVLTTLSLWRNKIVFVEGAKAIGGNGVLKNWQSAETKSATRAPLRWPPLFASTRS